jgi:hypothetical protein
MRTSTGAVQLARCVILHAMSSRRCAPAGDVAAADASVDLRIADSCLMLSNLKPHTITSCCESLLWSAGGCCCRGLRRSPMFGALVLPFVRRPARPLCFCSLLLSPPVFVLLSFLLVGPLSLLRVGPREVGDDADVRRRVERIRDEIAVEEDQATGGGREDKENSERSAKLREAQDHHHTWLQRRCPHSPFELRWTRGNSRRSSSR